jgi:hypothetical protein
MEDREHPELTNPELDALLQEWRTPVAPARLRLAVFSSQSVPWYRRWLATSIPIPVPIAVVLCVMLLFSGWQWGARRERARAETVHGGFASTAPAPTFQGFSPVAELRPRIIRGHHAPN